jgi:sialate O-acetylesterase
MNIFRKTLRYVFIFGFCLSLTGFSQIKLPKLISDGMVLQRNAKVEIWGWAIKNESVAVHFMGSTYNTAANDSGKWNIFLSDLKAGGPYKMVIIGGDTVTINDIMVGDVWLCSGQSNMEHTVGSFSWVYPEVIANSTNKYIRQFHVPERYDFNKAEKDFPSGSWKIANPQNVLNFSAVAYFFGKYIYEKYKVPIGLINSSLGGSPVESWLSEDALKQFPKYYNQAQMFKDSTLIKKIETSDNARANAWYTELWKRDKGYHNTQHIWYDTVLNTSDWASMIVPGYWAKNTNLGLVNGVIWFRKKVEIPSSMAGKSGKLILGRIVDADSAFINGKFIGTTSYQYPRRRYDISPGILRKGENTVVVRVISNTGEGGFVPDKPYQIEVDSQVVSLKGEWKYKVGTEMEPLPGQTFIRWMPLGLYNAMISPLLNYKIKGNVWYQGESNADRPIEYRKLFAALIRDWRNHWNESDFPFLFVQLPNFMQPRNQPSESNWALLRESQLDALSLPKTGMAVTIDIGEWNDIHPVDKKDVGKRLALAAEKVAYGDSNVVYSGPIYKSMNIEGNKIVLSFTNTGSGLIAKRGGSLKYFAIAGADKHFVWANAKIDGNKVIVWSDGVPHPVAVRYAWADDPEGANLYNKQGLPASPFRTDDFESAGGQ